LARAALRKRVDDQIEVLLPAGPARYLVLAVTYQ
jgi:transcription elongation factor GreB